MRVGVVCEGPTDFPAISEFFKDALLRQGVECDFTAIFPELDKTRPIGGWGNVLIWLGKNNPEMRVQRYFGGGLLSGGLSTEPYDAILIQLDSDIVDNSFFRDYVDQQFGIIISDTTEPAERAAQVAHVIKCAADFASMSIADASRHVPAVAVESTETWCVAAFHAQAGVYEKLRDSDLVNAFMNALEISESRIPKDSYENIDKNPLRRKRFCEKHAAGSGRISKSCPHFQNTLVGLSALK